MELKDSFVGRALGVDYFRELKTEAYVVVPPALIITDERGDTWTLGLKYNRHMEFNVLRNDRSTGEFASKIEWNGQRLRIYSRDGFKTWTGKSFI